MSDEDALLAAIAGQPEEDTPRLAYADWLDENAASLPDPELARVRAEYIRLQTERFRCPYWLPEHTARYGELCRREREIEGQYRTAILGLAAGADEVEIWFSRGFPCVRMSAETFLAHADRFAPLRPPTLTVTQAATFWYVLVTHPRFSLVTNLVMVSAQQRVWRDQRWSMSAGIIGRIGELAGGNRIRGLDLSWCRLRDEGVTHLAEHADVWHLEDLDLSHNEIEYTGLMDLLLSPIPQALRRVNLCGNRLNDLGAKAIAERWPANGSLKWLRLEGTNIGPLGRQLLLDRFGEKVELDTPPPP